MEKKSILAASLAGVFALSLGSAVFAADVAKKEETKTTAVKEVKDKDSCKGKNGCKGKAHKAKDGCKGKGNPYQEWHNTLSKLGNTNGAASGRGDYGVSRGYGQRRQKQAWSWRQR